MANIHVPDGQYTAMSPFELEHAEWRYVDSSYTYVRWISTSIFFLCLLVIASVISWLFWNTLPMTPHASIVAVSTIAIIWIWQLILIPYQVRAFRFTRNDTDLVVEHGVMFRKITIVPYGRMQYVGLEQGPILRHYGLANITLHTAASVNSTAINGLSAVQAHQLRQELTELGETYMAGL